MGWLFDALAAAFERWLDFEWWEYRHLRAGDEQAEADMAHPAPEHHPDEEVEHAHSLD